MRRMAGRVEEPPEIRVQSYLLVLEQRRGLAFYALSEVARCFT